MKTLVFDTETTGFAKFKSPASDPKQPHLVQLATLVTMYDEVLSAWDTIVYCPIEIPEGAAKVHGISTERSRSHGASLSATVLKFDKLLVGIDRVVCHNIRFDMKVILAAYHRAKLSPSMLLSKATRCTMASSTNVLKLPSSHGLYKWPTLTEAYKALVDEAGFGGAHSADADTMACWKVLRALEAKGVALQ